MSANKEYTTRPRGTGETEMVEIESASREGLVHFVDPARDLCSCEAATYGADDCHHRRFVRAQRRIQDGTYHRVEERRGLYGPYYVVVDHEGTAVTGPTTSRLEAMAWAAEEDGEAPLASPEVA